ncbi:uncharacterized protein LOC142985470 [Anticarsia gemmatalis]|uniref:uncharacterized protein LOC142985470 n=1 Tax=Anticarsia gemmatalis TaxID=129554 RepID=UPI003F75BD17
MDDDSEIILKKICCTCLSRDRKLFQLCRIKDGVNDLYTLLVYDYEAYKESFFKDSASLYICWECRAVMCKLTKFRQQACTAQRHLTAISDGRTDVKCLSTLSTLSTHHITEYLNISGTDEPTPNFIDCGYSLDVKVESDEEIPLSELHSNWVEEDQHTIIQNTIIKQESGTHYTQITISEADLKQLRASLSSDSQFVNSEFKCESCLVIFENQVDVDAHKTSMHIEQPDHILCEICLSYIKQSLYNDHKEAHYIKYSCIYCEYESYKLSDMLEHDTHAGQAVGRKKKGSNKSKEFKPGSKVKKKNLQNKNPNGYLCRHCNKRFDNHNQRWKHIQRLHAEGHTCPTCGKSFPFRTSLARHERTHKPSPPRVECPTCNKQIRVDHIKTHARIHSARERYSCVECDKSFVSRASYEHHLKYTLAHTLTDLLKYKCSLCDKGYRSRGELRDHVNYQHMRKTQHKCPICNKALATPRCITRHVRRAHHGIKERVRDKICQQCGKAFLDKKGLHEHELIHTGERPLSCEVCGVTFRQSASLYTHRRRVHRVLRADTRLLITHDDD